MSDFKWEMQQRIDQGMNPDQAYEATRESYADAADLARKRAKEEGPRIVFDGFSPEVEDALKRKLGKAEALDTLADNETDEAEYHRLRAEAAEERGEKS